MVISSWLPGQWEGSGQEEHPCCALGCAGEHGGLFTDITNVKHIFGGYRDPVLSATIWSEISPIRVS